MSLPRNPLTKKTITIAGEEVELRSLSRGQVIAFAQMSNDKVADAEKFLIVCGTGWPKDEVAQWYEEVPSDDAKLIAESVLEISGLTEEVGKA